MQGEKQPFFGELYKLLNVILRNLIVVDDEYLKEIIEMLDC